MADGSCSDDKINIKSRNSSVAISKNHFSKTKLSSNSDNDKKKLRNDKNNLEKYGKSIAKKIANNTKNKLMITSLQQKQRNQQKKQQDLSSSKLSAVVIKNLNINRSRQKSISKRDSSKSNNKNNNKNKMTSCGINLQQQLVQSKHSQSSTAKTSTPSSSKTAAIVTSATTVTATATSESSTTATATTTVTESINQNNTSIELLKNNKTRNNIKKCKGNNIIGANNSGGVLNNSNNLNSNTNSRNLVDNINSNNLNQDSSGNKSVTNGNSDDNIVLSKEQNPITSSTSSLLTNLSINNTIASSVAKGPQGLLNVTSSSSLSSNSLSTQVLSPIPLKVASTGSAVSANITKSSSSAMESTKTPAKSNMDILKKDTNSTTGNGIKTGNKTLSNIPEQDMDDNRNKKKRCSDRYDSSESSDSGVATLSCTDSSTASSDASDPGSPFSPVSLGDDAHHHSTTPSSSSALKVNMPPQTVLTNSPVLHSSHYHPPSQQQQTSLTVQTSTPIVKQHQHHQQLQQKWPWSTATTTSLSTNNNSNSNNTNNFNNNSNSNANNGHKNQTNNNNNNNVATGNKHKRLSINSSDTISNIKKVRISSTSTIHHHNQNNTSAVDNKLNNYQTNLTGLVPSTTKRLKSSTTSLIDESSSSPSSSSQAQQTKITGYFKSQMKPLNNIKKDTTNVQQQEQQITSSSTLSNGIDKYFNIFSKTKEDKDQSHKLSSIKNYDVRTLHTTLPPSLKKIERRTTKIAQVAPNPRKTLSSHPSRPKSPKKHIAIAPRTAEVKKNCIANTNSTNSLRKQSSSTTPSIHHQIELAHQHAKISQPTVLLTAIRIPQPSTQSSQVQTAQQSSIQKGTSASDTNATKLGSTQVFQIPVMPNLVQIPNILTTTAPNLVMNNGQITRMGSGAQYFLNGAVIKLQQIVTPSPSNNNDNNNSVLTMETGLPSNNIVPTLAQAVPLTTAAAVPVSKSTSQQSLQQQQQSTPTINHPQTTVNANGCSSASVAEIHHQGPSFTTSQRLSTQPVFMATTTGLLLNAATLPAVIASAKLSELPQVLPALQPIQSNTQSSTSILPNLSTLLHSSSSAQFIVNQSEPPALTSIPNTLTPLPTCGNFITSKTTLASAPTSVAPNTISSVPPPLVTLASARDSVSTVTAGLMRQKLPNNNLLSDMKESNTMTTEKLSQLHLKLMSPPPLISTVSTMDDLPQIKSITSTKETIFPQFLPTNEGHPYVSDIFKSVQHQHQQSQLPMLISTKPLSSLSTVNNNSEIKNSNRCLPPPSLSQLSSKHTTFERIQMTTATTALTEIRKTPQDIFTYDKSYFKLDECGNDKAILKCEGVKDDELIKNELMKCEFDFDEELEHEVTEAAKIAAAAAAASLKADDFKIEEKLFKLDPFMSQNTEIENDNNKNVMFKPKQLLYNTVPSDSSQIDDLLLLKPTSEESSLSNESGVESQSSPQPVLQTAATDTPKVDARIITDTDSNLSSLLPKSTVSPILSQPKTIRFPAINGERHSGYRFGSKGTKRHDGVCYWDNCNEKYDNSSKLLDHLQQQHVNTQTGPFQCLWNGCKVHSRESCSRRWLERHVLSHGGTKPFKCIVDGCGLRFGSQLALQKHVNGHFNNVENKDNQSKRTSDPPVPKLLRKNGKKLRYRRQPFSARMFDFFDSGVMEGLQHRLMITGSLANGPKGSITFKGQTMGRRTTTNGTKEIFVKWNPSEIIPDEWIPETTNALIKIIPIHTLRCQERIALQKRLNHANQHKDINTIFKSEKSSSLTLSICNDLKRNQGQKQSRKSKSSSLSSSSTSLSVTTSLHSFSSSSSLSSSPSLSSSQSS